MTPKEITSDYNTEQLERALNERRRKHIMKRIKDLIELARPIFYTEEARAGISEAEIFGNIVSHYFEWSGSPIIEAFLSALEDANYHTLRGQIEELLKQKPQN